MRGRIPSLLLLFVGSMLMLAPLAVRGLQQPTRLRARARELWITTWGGTGYEEGSGVAVGSEIYIVRETESFEEGSTDAFRVDVRSSIYIVGETRSFGAGYDDAFLACYDVDGNQLWNTTWGGTGYENGYGVAVGSDIYIVGETDSFGAGYADAFLACYDVDGNQLWNTTWGGTGTEYGFGVAVGSDNVYIVGYTTSFGAGEKDAFLACYDVDGNQLWNTTWGGAMDEWGRGVAVGSDIYIVGATGSFGAEHGDAFLACYDVDGNQLWNTTWGVARAEGGNGVAVGSNIYIVGTTNPIEAGWADVFLASFDPDGNQLWNTTWGGSGVETGGGVAVDSDNVYIVGGTSFVAENYDAFMACYDTDGNQLWNTTLVGTGDEWGRGVAVGSDNVYIVGRTHSFGAGNGDAFLACYDVVLEPDFPSEYGFLPVAPFNITIEPKKVDAKVGDEVTLNCKIEASPGFSESITFTIRVKASIFDVTHYVGIIDPPYPQEFSYSFEIPKVPVDVTATATVIGASEEHAAQESVKIKIRGPAIPGFPMESIIIGLTVGILIIWMMQRRN